MVGSTVAENVVERQYEEKLMTSRTSTPASAGRSRRRRRVSLRVRAPTTATASTPSALITRLLRVRAPIRATVSTLSASSRDLFPGQEHEHVLEVRRPPVPRRRVAVDAQDRHARAGPPRRQPRRPRLGLDLHQPLGRAVDLHRLPARVLLDE